MELRELFRSAGLAAVVLGVGASLVLTVGGCGDSQGIGVGPATSLGGQATAQPQLPALDVNTPRDFQTATFAFG